MQNEEALQSPLPMKDLLIHTLKVLTHSEGISGENGNWAKG